MKEHIFSVDFMVRDYECDIQGIVNNSVYQNYLEHARHLYLKSIGIDFKKFTERGIILVVIRAELDYKASLSSGDEFYVTVEMVKESSIKFAFIQNIYRKNDEKLMLKGKIIGTALNQRGRPEIPAELKEIFSDNGE